MKSLRWFYTPEHQFHVVGGLCDGIMSALAFGSGKLFDTAAPMTFGLALRLALANSISGLLVSAIARYAELRSELMEAERQLNLASRGYLATTRLGHWVLWESVGRGLIGGWFSFMGTMCPLSLGALAPEQAWLSVAACLSALAVLGFFLARLLRGHALGWMAALTVGGAFLTVLGIWLRIT